MIFRPMTRKHLLLATALTLCLSPLAARAESAYGAYLAAWVASTSSDYAASVDWATRALGGDPSNPALLEDLVLSNVGVGDMPSAAQNAPARHRTTARESPTTG